MTDEEREQQRAARKDAYFAYRERARELYEGYDAARPIKIPLHANVQICEGGAFVEAVVWVPEEKFAVCIKD